MEVKQDKENGLNKKESKYTIEKIKLFLWKDHIIYKHIISPIKGKKKKRHNIVSGMKNSKPIIWTLQIMSTL